MQDNKTRQQLEKVAVATHCNLRPSDVAPVVLARRSTISLPNFSTVGQRTTELLTIQHIFRPFSEFSLSL